MDLFENHRKKELDRNAPLASRMRPRSLDQFVGQQHLLGRDRVFRRSIESDQIPSLILWGPPGSGKTSLAFLIANLTRSHFDFVSAVTSGVGELRKIIENARERIALYSQRTVLFVDEIHRFNKAQQDVILPHIEEGIVTFIGATTENPSFEVIAPLLSRCRVFPLKPLEDEEIQDIIVRAIQDHEHGLGPLSINVSKEAMDYLVAMADGDARVSLNALELAALGTDKNEQGFRGITLEIIEDALQHKAILYDSAGDQHYDTISALIKSVRGSDPDAAIYWLGRMIEAGEDPLFIARRLVILASEDVGLADPMGLPIAISAQQAVHFIGMPEGAITLAHACVYLATAPKSNSAYSALNLARQDARNTRNQPVPIHLRNPVTKLMKDMGHGEGYKYSHGYPGHFAPMNNLPDSLTGRRYYIPSDQGYEKTIANRLDEWWKAWREAQR